MSETANNIEQITVALCVGGVSQALISFSAKLAKQLNASLSAVLFEAEELEKAYQLPCTREVVTLTAQYITRHGKTLRMIEKSQIKYVSRLVEQQARIFNLSNAQFSRIDRTVEPTATKNKQEVTITTREQLRSSPLIAQRILATSTSQSDFSVVLRPEFLNTLPLKVLILPHKKILHIWQLCLEIYRNLHQPIYILCDRYHTERSALLPLLDANSNYPVYTEFRENVTDVVHREINISNYSALLF